MNAKRRLSMDPRAVYLRERQAALRARGICIQCARSKAAPGVAKCDPCAERHARHVQGKRLGVHPETLPTPGKRKRFTRLTDFADALLAKIDSREVAPLGTQLTDYAEALLRGKEMSERLHRKLSPSHP